MVRRKELKEEYKQMRPPMGILCILSKTSGKHYLEPALDLSSRKNRAVFQLKMGSHPHKELQKAWKQDGKENFEVIFLDELPYTEDDSQKDYQTELAELCLMWQEKLAQDGVTFY